MSFCYFNYRPRVACRICPVGSSPRPRTGIRESFRHRHPRFWHTTFKLIACYRLQDRCNTLSLLHPTRAAILEWRLGPGESAVLALTIEHQLEAIIDDLAGRKCAARFGIPVRGTLGIVLAAKKRGVIQQARPVIEYMTKTGLYLSKKVLDKALERVGE